MISTCLLALALATAPDADLKLLADAGLPTDDGPALLDYFRRRAVTDADRAAIDQLVRQLGSPKFELRERASAKLVEFGASAVVQLRQAETNPDVEIARRAERCLAAIEKVPGTALSSAVARRVAKLKPPGAVGVLLAYMPAAEDEVVADELRDAIAALAATDGQPDPVLNRSLNDPSPVIRAAAAEALIRTGRPDATVEARKLMADFDAEVRLRVTLALVTVARDKTAVPALIELLAELPQGSGWKAEAVLVRLAGELAPAEALAADEASRRRCRDAWGKWWAAHGQTVDLAKLGNGPRLVGHTLLVMSDPRKLAGPSGSRVVELNAKGEIAWRIDHLQNALDAAVIGRDRVLIAEYAGKRVTERDFAGNILWTKTIDLPVGLDPLPNGGLLIACRGRVVELDAERDELGNFPRLDNDIVAAKKLANGETLVLTTKGSVLRLNREWKLMATHAVGRVQFYAGLDALPNGRFLVTHKSGVTEYDAAGTELGSMDAPEPTSVQRLPNGNTLVAGVRKVVEMDRGGQVVWEYQPPESVRAYRARRR